MKLHYIHFHIPIFGCLKSRNDNITILLLLVGGWAIPLKNMKVNWDDEIPNISGKIKNGNQTTNQIIYIYIMYIYIYNQPTLLDLACEHCARLQELTPSTKIRRSYGTC